MTIKAAVSVKFTNSADIDKAIASIKSRGAKLDADIQACALSILAHIDKHGDITKFTALYDAMPKGSRRNALVAWACEFGKIAVNLEPETKKLKPFLFKRDAETDLAGAADKPWFKFKPEKPVSEEFDFAGSLQRLLQKAQKAKDAGQAVKGLDLFEKVMGAAGAEA